jgi:diadenosine tetraphosphate (Ap4A) HIT family hydrolase
MSYNSEAEIILHISNNLLPIIINKHVNKLTKLQHDKINEVLKILNNLAKKLYELDKQNDK